MEIGTVCNLYKNCTICGEKKYYKEFGKKTSHKRRGACKTCFRVKKRQKPMLYLKYKDRVLNKSERIKVQLVEGRGYSYKTTYENAMTLVQEGLAFVIDETKIFKPYSYKTIRRMIFERDSYTCFYCHRRGTTLEHIKPISKGGLTTFSNCVVSCYSCNQKKGSMDFYDFINKVNTDLALRQLRESEKRIIERKFGIIQLLLQRVSEQISNLYDDSNDNEIVAFRKILEVENEVNRIKEMINKGTNMEFEGTIGEN